MTQKQWDFIVDWKHSHNSFLCTTDGIEYLDLHGLYATNVFGYNFQYPAEFYEEIRNVINLKSPTCLFDTEEEREFIKAFKSIDNNYRNFAFASAGTLAIEQAIHLVALERDNPLIYSIYGSYHGQHGFASYLSNNNLFPNPYTNLECKYLEDLFQAEIPDAIIIEPIQSSNYQYDFNYSFFQTLKRYCKEHDIILILDEIQTGGFVAGTPFYYHQLGIVPDILIFGKKFSISGLATNLRTDNQHLSLTWNGTLEDFIRGKYMIEICKNLNIEERVKKASELFTDLPHSRVNGLLIDFEVANSDDFMHRIYKRRVLVNKNGYKRIKLRPNLLISDEEIEKGIKLIKEELRNV